MKVKIIIITAIILLITAFGVFVAVDNKRLTVSNITVESEKVPDSFDGFVIAQISDLHNATLDEGNKSIVEALRECSPDIIAMTGDMIDSRHTDVPCALSLAKELTAIAPTYYVTGNHEKRISGSKEFEKSLSSLGVKVMKNEKCKIGKDGESITLIGIDDPTYQKTDPTLFPDLIGGILNDLTEDTDGYRVLLSHRPELIETYIESNVDLVFSGHAHGGQFRLTFIGGLFAPGQGIFPKYTSGLYHVGSTDMIVSRGIGNSSFPFRLFDPPELVIATLKSSS